jgi:hypothetical protein
VAIDAVAWGYYATRARFRGAVTLVTAAHVKLPDFITITNDHIYSVRELTRTPSFLTLKCAIHNLELPPAR